MKQKIRIALAQIGNVLGDIDKNLETHYQMIEQAIDEKCDLIMFPELSLTGYSLKDAVYDAALFDNDAKYDTLKELSRHISIVTGVVELSKNYEIFNSAFFYEDGQMLTKHRKVYLPTYGLFEEKRYFSSANRFRAFDSKLGRLGLLICEDVWHPSSSIILSQDGASVILTMAAGVARGFNTDERPENVQDWESINRALSIFTTSYIVFVNRVGVEDGLMYWGGSEIYDPHGRRSVKASYFEENLVIGEMDMLKLKHSRITSTVLSDEKLTVDIEELSRIHAGRKNY